MKKSLDNNIWVEKFRPKSFEEVINLDSRIPKIINQSMSHLLFVGGAGTGKTTVSKIIINNLDCDYLLLNASDERGIDTIRNKVKNFAMTKSSKLNKFKVVFLDEADGITPDGQQTLRNLMETYASNCRFILTCNFENKIIDPIKSRCSKFEFKKVSDSELLDLLGRICKEEKISYDKDTLKKIVEVSRGDIRKSINILQQNSINNELKPDITLESNIKEIFEKLKNKKFDIVRKELIEKNVDYENLILEIYNFTVENKNLSLETRKNIVLEISQCLFEMSFVLIKEITFSKFLIRLEEILQ